MPVRPRVLLVSAAAVLFALLAVGCDKEDKIVIENFPPSQENRPPLIVTYSPTFPTGTVQQISNFNPQGIALQVLVGDPDGLDDISAVTLGIDSVIVHRFILRPDTSTSFCLVFGYAANDTVATQAILPTPAGFSGFDLRQLTKTGPGLYAANQFGGWEYGFPDIFAAASNLQQWQGGCIDTEGFGGPWVVVPPAIAVQNEAVLTYADVEYRGGTVTVWDKVGANAVLNLPTLRIVFQTTGESNAAP